MLLNILISIYFFRYEIIVRTSAWSFVIQIPIQALCPIGPKQQKYKIILSVYSTWDS